MTLVAVILLGLILLVLIGILLVLNASFKDLQKYTESIHGLLHENKQSLNFLSDRISEIADNIERIYPIAAAIKYDLEHPSLYKNDPI